MGLATTGTGDAARRLTGGLRTGWIAMATFLALIALSAALVAAFDHSIGVADEYTRRDERELVNRYLRRSIEGMAAAEFGQIYWDEAMRRAVLSDDKIWQDEEYGAFLFSNFSNDSAYLVRPDGTLIHAWQNGRPTSPGVYQPLRAHVARLIGQSHATDAVSGLRRLSDGTPWPLDERGFPRARWSGSMTLRDGRPEIVTVASIVPDRTPTLLTRAPNFLVTTRKFDASVLARIGQDLNVPDISFVSARPANPADNAVALTASDGSHIGWLRWTSKSAGPAMLQRSSPLLWAWIVFFIAVVSGGTMILRRARQTARELIASEAQAQHNALHDPMSGLPNRMQYMQRLRSELTQCIEGRFEGDIFVAYIDLDGFKVVNDTLGHHVGDELVRQVALRLSAGLPSGDFISRFGGDEFVLMRRAMGGAGAADRFGAEVMALMKEPFVITGKNIDVTCSCGISWGPAQSEDPGELLRRADIALYRAKQRGRARYRRFTRDMDASVKLRLEMEMELRRAIARDELSVAYQPIVSLNGCDVVGVEALLRWEHPERGEIRPGLFVPIAEQSGLMNLLGNWMLRRVFTECRDWPSCDISVNLSPIQIMASEFLDTMADLVSSTGIDPMRVVLEITEGIMLDRSAHVVGVLRELNQMGFRIALDDFGTGYSSLSYLRSFQFERIKIDRSFVSNIESDADAYSILCAIASLGHTLRMKVVAEGVETENQRRLVQAAGCELIQGWLFYKAMPGADVLPLIKRSAEERLRLAS